MSENVGGQVMTKEGVKEMKNFFSKIGKFFSDLVKNKAALRATFDSSFEMAAKALPYIDMAATIASGVTPSKLDDAALALIKSKYPGLFDGSIKTGDELKLYTLGAATELVKSKYPEVGTTVARLAVQSAYAVKQNGEVDANKG